MATPWNDDRVYSDNAVDGSSAKGRQRIGERAEPTVELPRLVGRQSDSRSQRMLVPSKVSSSDLGRFAGWEVGPNGDVVPGVEVAAQGVELLMGQPQRLLAEEQVERRVRRFDGLDD